MLYIYIYIRYVNSSEKKFRIFNILPGLFSLIHLGTEHIVFEIRLVNVPFIRNSRVSLIPKRIISIPFIYRTATVAKVKMETTTRTHAHNRLEIGIISKNTDNSSRVIVYNFLSRGDIFEKMIGKYSAILSACSLR